MSSGHEHDLEITSPGRPETVEVADGVYAYVQPDGTWFINNTGFITGPQGVFSIDACSTERRTRAYLAAIAKVTAAPVRTVVNTHHHGDHTFGNALFPTATIVAHERARPEVIAFGPARELPFWQNPDWGHLPLEPPFLTFSDDIALHAGEERITVRHVGTAAHTTNDVIAWLPGPSVLFCGDLVFNGGTPFLLMGSVAGCVDALEQAVLPLGARTIVPGHGPVFEGTAPIMETLDYLRFVLDLAAHGRAAGASPLEAAREADLGRFAGWPDAERIVGNLHRAYAELDGTPRGGPVDVLAALTDMVAYNGGKPLTCLALWPVARARGRRSPSTRAGCSARPARARRCRGSTSPGCGPSRCRTRSPRWAGGTGIPPAGSGPGCTGSGSPPPPSLPAGGYSSTSGPR